MPSIENPVAIAKGIHLFPCRTQQLSPYTPKVLDWKRSGRIGSCRLRENACIERCRRFCVCHWSTVTRTRRGCTPGSPCGCRLPVYWAGRRACVPYGFFQKSLCNLAGLPAVRPLRTRAYPAVAWCGRTGRHGSAGLGDAPTVPQWVIILYP